MMAEKKKITISRERLDTSLASYGLSNEESVKLLVKTQILRSPFSGTEGQSKTLNLDFWNFSFFDLWVSFSS